MSNIPTSNLNPAFNYPSYQNVLHLQPLSHHIGLALTSAGTSLQQHAKMDHWRGKILTHITKGLLFSGYILNSIIASIETLATLIFSLPFLFLQTATKGKILFLHHFSIKLCAYTIHSLLIVGTQILCIKRGYYSKHHVINAIADHVIHGTAAVMSQIIGFGFDHMAGRNQVSGNQLPPSFARMIGILVELSPRLIRDATKAISRDFNLSNSVKKDVNLQNFVEANPRYSEILNRFNLNNLEDSQYRRSLLKLFGDFFAHSGILNPLTSCNGEEIGLFGIYNNQINQQYQNELKEIIKMSFIELHDNEEWIKLLSMQRDVDDGRKELLTYSAFLQIAFLSQLKEIESEITCPEKFEGAEFKIYNKRRPLLIATKKQLQELNDLEKQLLIKKLLLRGEFDLQGISEERIKNLQKLFNDITTLAIDFYKGSLIIQNTIDLSYLNQGSINQTFGEINLLQKACEEATQEINSRKKTELL